MTHDPLCNDKPIEHPNPWFDPDSGPPSCQCSIIADARKHERAAIVQDLNDLYLASLLAGPEWLGGIQVARDVVKDKQL